jgi:hypothetical protein
VQRETPTGRHCDRHNRALARGEVCQACVLSPAAPGAELTSSDVDDDLLRLAAECEAHKRKLWGEAEKLLDDGTAQDKSTACKLSAEATKWLRVSREIKGEVSQRKQLREAIAHEQAMTGKRGPH